MSTRQHEVCFFVLGQSEGRGLIRFQIVATIAGVEIGRRGKLIGVPIAVAIGAALELHLEQRIFPFRDMALRTLEPGMRALQWIRAQSMFFDREQRGLPSLHVVTRAALAAIGALGELAVMSVLMAIHALLEGKGLLEISTGVALCTIDGGVLAQQRKLRSGVIKVLAHSQHRDLLPAASGVARLAALGETAAMRILVAIRTLIERNASILGFAVGSVRMTLRALYLRVQAGQRISRLRVIELRDSDLLPVDGVVA